jgi:hypothetical protein
LTQHTLTANKSAQYLKQAKDREAKKDQLLALTINKGKNEAEYDCLFKMGDANEKLQTLGETMTYRAYRGAVFLFGFTPCLRTEILEFMSTS